MSCLSWLVVIAALLAVTQALLKEDKNVAHFFTHVACRSDAWAMKYPNLLQCDTAHPFMLFTKEQCQRGCKDRGADVFTFAQGSDWPFTHADMVELDKEKTKLRGEAFEPWRTSITVGTNPDKLPHFWVKHTDTVESYRVSIGETANGITVDDEKPANWKKAALVEWENNKRVLCLCQVNEASINLQRSDKNDDDPYNNKLNQDKKELLDEEKRANENLKNDQKSKQMAIIIALITTGVMIVVGLSVVLIVLKATSEQAGRAPMSVYGQAASRM